jgi:uncharacterized protein (TIGR02118 family)
MSVSLQVLYPVQDETQFDYGYYLSTHMALVSEHMGPHIERTLVTRGAESGSDVPAPFHAIATIVFADQEARNAALKASPPVMADIPNFTNSRPQILMGEVVG